jgi:putative oxidoreductase
MKQILGRYLEQVYPITRIVIGLLFFCHGAMKLFGLFREAGQIEGLFSLMGLAGVIECFGGLLIAVGLLSSYAAFLASGMMAVAYFKALSPRGLWPINNGGELAVLYCFVFLFIAAKGSGKWSLDAAIKR